jgi:hypothetical protein
MAKDGREEKDGKVYLTCEGTTYEVPPFDFEADVIDLEAYYKAHRKQPVDALNDVAEQLQSAKPFVREALMDRAYATINQGPKLQGVTQAELGLWLDTLDGKVYSLFISLRKKYPDMTMEKTRYIVGKVGKAEIEKLIDKANAKTQAVQLRDAAEEAGVLHQIIGEPSTGG